MRSLADYPDPSTEATPTATTALRDRLRRETARAHAELDDALSRSGCFETLPGYIAFLRAFHSFQFAKEQELTGRGAADVIADWPKRCRSHLLVQDLEALQCTQPDSVAETCVVAEMRQPQIEHVLGTAYVLEGSTLGGAVLLRQVARLGITAQSGGAFLASYGAERGSMWQQFLATLAEWECRGVEADAVIRAANATFEDARRELLPATARAPGTGDPRTPAVSESARARPPGFA